MLSIGNHPTPKMFLTLVNYFTSPRPRLYTDTCDSFFRVTVEPDLIDIEKGKYHQ